MLVNSFCVRCLPFFFVISGCAHGDNLSGRPAAVCFAKDFFFTTDFINRSLTVQLTAKMYGP